MKKNPVGRALIQTDPGARRASRLRIPVRIFCIFLALIIWLLIVNLNQLSDQGEKITDPPAEMSVI